MKVITLKKQFIKALEVSLKSTIPALKLKERDNYENN